MRMLNHQGHFEAEEVERIEFVINLFCFKE